MTRPYYAWFPGDASRDAAYRSCSLEARGLWRELLDLMHSCRPYGHLAVGNRALTPAEIGKMLGEDPRKVRRMLAELLAKDVAKLDDNGAIYSPRLIRAHDEVTAYQAKKSRAGKLGAEARWGKSQPEEVPMANVSPASASASASASSPPTPPPPSLPTRPPASTPAGAIAAQGNGVVTAIEYASRVTVAANTGLRANPEIAERFNELVASNQLGIAKEWHAAGIPLAIAERAIHERAKHLRSPPRHLSYFKNVVTDLYARETERGREAGYAPPAAAVGIDADPETEQRPGLSPPGSISRRERLLECEVQAYEMEADRRREAGDPEQLRLDRITARSRREARARAGQRR